MTQRDPRPSDLPTLSSQIVDLTHPLAFGLQIYPGDPEVRIAPADVTSQLGAVQPGAIVVFKTLWSERFGQPAHLEHPYLDVAIAERLRAAGVTVVGVDTLSPDRTDPTADPAELPFHKVFLGAGSVTIENLTNLSAIDSARDPWISALPLPFTGLDGSPVRAVAMHHA